MLYGPEAQERRIGRAMELWTDAFGRSALVQIAES
jgi:hypothetical protein